MITDIFLTIIMLCFIVFGFTRPHIALISVMWVDIVKPQNVSYSFLAGKPLSLIMTLFFFIVMVSNYKKLKLPRNLLYHFLVLGFMIWITIATYLAEFQLIAWIKYDVVIKTLIFVYFIPFVLHKRSHFELLLWVCSSAFGLYIFMAGVKTLFGGGGYGVSLVGHGGFMYSEGSTLATLAVCLLPIYQYLYKHSKVCQNNIWMKYALIGFGFCVFLTLIGTQARTGLVALVVYLILIVYQSKNKIKTIFFAAFIPLIFMFFASDAWFNRMNTIEQGATTEKSAVGRIVVWRWTVDYVKERPFFGGGFYAFNANAGVLHLYQKEGEEAIVQDKGKAFHNIFFEVLGETGYGGLAFFIGLILHGLLLSNVRIKQIKKRSNSTADSDWAINSTINMSLLIYCAGGMFIGIAFYPWLYYLYSLSVAMENLKEN